MATRIPALDIIEGEGIVGDAGLWEMEIDAGALVEAFEESG